LQGQHGKSSFLLLHHADELDVICKGAILKKKRKRSKGCMKTENNTLYEVSVHLGYLKTAKKQ
jgi:hypothetical protein